ncbi:MAG TPA: hypothetical protein VHL53_05225 [Acidimicrobiia bacterium]|nr:hypothetical protein [Acidimicrobiia bacterium]
MRLQVCFRVAGHTKSSFTYLQLLCDLVDVMAGPAVLLEAGFLDFRDMVPLAIHLPPPEMGHGDRELHCDLAAVKLRSAIKAGIGIDPRQMSGRLAVVVDADDGGGQTPEEAAGRLRQRGYRVDVLEDGP